VANSKDLTSLLITHENMIHANVNFISTVQKKRNFEEKDISHSDQSLARNKEWKISKTVVGVHVNAVVLILALLGIDNIDPEQLARLEGRTIRRLGQGQIDEKGKDVSGYLVISDAGAALLFSDDASSRKWANKHTKVNTSRAPSLTYIDSGNPRVCLL